MDGELSRSEETPSLYPLAVFPFLGSLSLQEKMDAFNLTRSLIDIDSVTPNGPGSIRVAHTAEERIAKRSIVEAVEIYARMVTQLLAGQQGSL
jgi:hypothetical protein